MWDTSGGVWGLERGYCLMIGGPSDAVLTSIRSSSARARARHVARTPRRAVRGTAEQGYLDCGPLRAPATSSRWCTTASSTA